MTEGKRREERRKSMAEKSCGRMAYNTVVGQQLRLNMQKKLCFISICDENV